MKRKFISLTLCAALLFAFGISAFAVETVPSIEQKGVPEVVETSDPSIELIPLFDSDEDSAVRVAYEDIKEVDLGDDIVIRDLFDVVGNVDSGTVVLDVSTYGDEIVILEYRDGTWEVIPAERIIVNDDGTITIILEDMCPLAIATGVVEESEGQGSCDHLCCKILHGLCCKVFRCKGTEHCHCLFWIIVILIILLLTVYAIIRHEKKKREERKEKREEAARQRREERKKNKTNL